MKTLFFDTISSLKSCRLLFASVLVAGGLVSAQATTIYDSGGFETFVPHLRLFSFVHNKVTVTLGICQLILIVVIDIYDLVYLLVWLI